MGRFSISAKVSKHVYFNRKDKQISRQTGNHFNGGKKIENLTHEYESVQNKNTQAFILKHR